MSKNISNRYLKNGFSKSIVQLIKQFSAFQEMFWQSYSEKLTISNECINKRVRIFTHRKMCVSKITSFKATPTSNYFLQFFQKDAFCLKNFWNFNPLWRFLVKTRKLQKVPLLSFRYQNLENFWPSFKICCLFTQE